MVGEIELHHGFFPVPSAVSMGLARLTARLTSRFMFVCGYVGMQVHHYLTGG